jgi:hypothetical protein
MSVMTYYLPAALPTHLRTGRCYQSERPAASLPARLGGSRFGAMSPWLPCWADRAPGEGALIPFERFPEPPGAA